MHRINVNKDIQPLSEFRAHVASYIQQVQKTNRPLVITHHGRSTAVLLNVAEYEALIDKLELFEDIRTGQQQVSEGKYISQADVKKRILKRIKK